MEIGNNDTDILAIYTRDKYGYINLKNFKIRVMVAHSYGEPKKFEIILKFCLSEELEKYLKHINKNIENYEQISISYNNSDVKTFYPIKDKLVSIKIQK